MARAMLGASVHILQCGEFNNMQGTLVNTHYDSDTNNMIYTVRLSTGKTLSTPAIMCALYYPVDADVRIVCGTYIGHKATITAARFDGDSYCQRVCISSPEFPHDIHIDIPVSHLTLYVKQFE